MFPGIGFGPFLHSLGGGQRRPPSRALCSDEEMEISPCQFLAILFLLLVST
ncbi:hypothetical protein AMTRI_Chr11g157140 [Amborella trichopoda]